MITSLLRRRATRIAAGAATVLLAASYVLPAAPAHADPRQLYGGLVAVGSDTVQDVANALAGVTNDVDYTPLHSTVATGRKVLDSWDAIPPAGTDGNSITCIAPRGGTSFNRPNGSGQGASALSRAIDGATYGNSSCGPATGKVVSGLIDLARSSSGPAGTCADPVNGPCLTYVPFGRDGVSYAYYTTGTATAITDLTAAELASLFSGASTGQDVTHGAVTTHIIPCGIQSGSGTRKFWLSALGGISDSTYDASTATCTPSGQQVEENNATRLKQKGDAVGGNNEFIIAFSGASWIAQNNGKAPSTLVSGVNLGGISNDQLDGSGNNIGTPMQGSAPNLTPNSSFYASTRFGRFVYFVFDSARVQPGTTGNGGLKQMFISTAATPALLCQSAAQATVNAFGFASLTAGTAQGQCGSPAQQDALHANNGSNL